MRAFWPVTAAAFSGGLVLGNQLFQPDVVRVAIIGIGFIAASVLPTITLLVNGLTATGRSVQAINDLHAEMTSSIKQLFWVLFMAILSVAVLAATGADMAAVQLAIPGTGHSVTDPFGRLVDASALVLLVLLGINLKAIPASIYRSLDLRRSIAVEEARQKNKDSLAKVSGTTAFPTAEGFGAKVRLTVDA